jgi:hypothetical protein
LRLDDSITQKNKSTATGNATSLGKGHAVCNKTRTTTDSHQNNSLSPNETHTSLADQIPLVVLYENLRFRLSTISSFVVPLLRQAMVVSFF